MPRLANIVLLSLGLGCVQGQETVLLWPGEVRGTSMTTRNGKNISAFLGIPYAKPPVGPLRFRTTDLLIAKDNQVFIADTDPNPCPQLNSDGEVIGDEDCLYLNIYRPTELPSFPLPTMVYFHGGNFMTGSGSSIEAGPEYLLDRDIVLVTVNYRLGVLGFLSTGDKSAPGNYGLKDQAIALEWVRRYILAFDGNPTRVTIFGQGAGGAATSFHALSRASKGLFRRFISQSGNAFCYWAFHEIDSYKNRAKTLGSYLNCPTDNSKALVECLQTRDVSSLVDTNDLFENQYWQTYAWGPTQEGKDIRGAFLPFHPRLDFLQKRVEMQDLSAIIGNVVDDGRLWTAEFQTSTSALFDKIANDVPGFFQYMTRLFFDVSSTVEWSASQQEMVYINGTEPSDKEAFTQNITSYLTDIGFIHPTSSQMKTMLRDGPKNRPYYYSFDYRGTYSRTSLTTGNNDNIGETHGDELIYLFPPKNLNGGSSEFEISESDGRMIDAMVDLWTSFAAEGVPITNSSSDPTLWQPYNETIKNNLKIGNGTESGLSLEYNYRIIWLEFWELLAQRQITLSYLNAYTG